MSIGRTISGIFVLLIGVALLAVKVFFEPDFPVLMGAFFVLFGIIILLNRAEDDIEQIKESKSVKKSKTKSKRKK
jgi:hypothetical protein